jgi:hypothetical protein
MPGENLLDDVALAVDHGRRADALLGFVVGGDDADDRGLQLLARQFRELVIVEIAQGAHDGREPCHAARLRALLFEQVHDLTRGHRNRLQRRAHVGEVVAGVRAKQPVGLRLPDGTELDPETAVLPLAITPCRALST